MKKIFTITLAALMLMGLASCGSKNEMTPDTEPASESTSAEQIETTAAPEETTAAQTEASSNEVNSVEKVFIPATSSETGAYATIKISADIKMDDESAWLGLCPTGKNYITELEADEVDTIWFSMDAHEENDPTVFSCDFSSVEDGTYAVVVATSDDENVG